MKDPESLSGRYAQEAVRRVHAADAIPPDTPVRVHPDPKVPGANYVDPAPTADGHTDSRYWVGVQGEIEKTATDGSPTTSSPGYQRARTRYTSAVERVRLRYSTPVSEELFALPDTHVPEAFFVYDRQQAQTVRWVAPDGTVHDGYRLVDGTAQWDESTAAARREVLRSSPGTAALADS